VPTRGETFFAPEEREILTQVVERLVASDDPAAPAVRETDTLATVDGICAGLDERDVAMLGYAEAVARNASQVSAHDIEGLRAAGFTDPQIADIALCAAFRCFVARFYDATGAGPEPAFLDEDEDFRQSLAVGRRL